MKCPKCHYLSFEPEPRCKHCGYSFSLSEPDLAIRHAEDGNHEALLADFPMRDSDVDRSAGPMTLGPIRPRESATAAASASALAMTLDRPGPAPDFPAEPPKAKPLRPVPTTELPLFVKGLADAETGTPDPPVAEPEQSVFKTLAVAQAPLAVRRASEAPRPQMTTSADAQPARKLGPFDHDLLEDLHRIEAKAAGRPAVSRSDLAAASTGAVRRMIAGAIDLLFLGAISAAVVWFTLRQCDLTWQQAQVLPIGPMAAFLAMVVVGYLFLFTAASGQTIGKMLVGLRVVADPDSGSEPPTIRQASYRALLTLPSVLLLGAGFLPALFRPGLALHDRLAHTRVVRA